MLLAKANQLLAENKLKEAEFHFKTLLESNPENGEALFGLGRIALRLGRYDAAVYVLQRACERLPNMIEPLHALADAYDGMHSPKDALKVLEHTKTIASHNPDPHYYLAQHYLTYGQTEQAYGILSQALHMGNYPVKAFIIHELVQFERFDEQQNYINDLHQFLTLTNNLRLKMVCYYALGKSYDVLDDTKQAFNYYVLANKLQRKLSYFRTSELAPLYLQIIKHNTAELITSLETSFTSTFTPVFIIGIPRSGLTLFEQMLAKHKNVASLGEDTSINNQIITYLEQRTQLLYPECLTQLSPKLLKNARNIYINHIKKAPSVRPYMVTKLAENCQSLGLINVLFPNAKIINVQRNHQALTWSVFSNYFIDNEPYFCSLTEFDLYYDLYQQLLEHWYTLMPNSLFDITYEQLITEPKTALSNVCKFLGIAYTDSLLDFYKSNNPVTTVTKIPIRKPLNAKSIDKYKRYENALQQLMRESRTMQVSQ